MLLFNLCLLVSLQSMYLTDKYNILPLQCTFQQLSILFTVLISILLWNTRKNHPAFLPVTRQTFTPHFTGLDFPRSCSLLFTRTVIFVGIWLYNLLLNKFTVMNYLCCCRCDYPLRWTAFCMWKICHIKLLAMRCTTYLVNMVPYAKSECKCQFIICVGRQKGNNLVAMHYICQCIKFLSWRIADFIPHALNWGYPSPYISHCLC